MSNFNYSPLNKLINENIDKLDEILIEYLSLLSQLTKTPIISNDEFMNNAHIAYEAFVTMDKNNNKVLHLKKKVYSSNHEE